MPAASAPQARALAEQFAPAAQGMWTTPLSPTGELPATHWISSGLIDQQFAALLPLAEYPADSDPMRTPGHPEVCAHLATEAGMTVTPEQVAALFAASDVSAEAAQTAMARMGLMIASPTESQE